MFDGCVRVGLQCFRSSTPDSAVVYWAIKNRQIRTGRIPMRNAVRVGRQLSSRDGKNNNKRVIIIK